MFSTVSAPREQRRRPTLGYEDPLPSSFPTARRSRLGTRGSSGLYILGSRGKMELVSEGFFLTCPLASPHPLSPSLLALVTRTASDLTFPLSEIISRAHPRPRSLVMSVPPAPVPDVVKLSSIHFYGLALETVLYGALYYSST
jgi:hypothetical protein